MLYLSLSCDQVECTFCTSNCSYLILFAGASFFVIGLHASLLGSETPEVEEITMEEV